MKFYIAGVLLNKLNMSDYELTYAKLAIGLANIFSDNRFCVLE